jgi:sulfiredoxin
MSDNKLMQNHTLQVADIYIPTARRKTLDPAKAEEIAESMIEEGQITPIQVRKGRERFVLIEGLHRLEACKLLGEETIISLFVQARRR